MCCRLFILNERKQHKRGDEMKDYTSTEYTARDLIDYCLKRIEENTPITADATLYVIKCALTEMKGKIK